MAPKKKEQQQKMSLGDFMNDSGFGGGSWADEVEETYVTVGTQPLPASDRPRYGGGSSGMSSAWQDRGYSSIRENLPQTLPDKPPYTAHLGNLAYDATNESVADFFEGCEIVNVRLIEDREMQRPKGFGYVEFVDVEALKKALTLDGQSFNGRMIKIKIADPPRGGDARGGESSRDLSDWTRKGPLPDLPGRSGRAGSDFGGGDRERRAPRDPAAETRAPREINWERRGPLAPLSPQEGAPGPREGSRTRAAPEGLGERGESHRGSRQGSASWGEGRQEGSRPPRREQAPERTATAAEKDTQWRTSMRPDAAKAQEESEAAPASPSAPAAAPVGRPRLNLQKRTVSEATDAATTAAGGDAKASPFGAARPINTAAREQAIEEKRQVAIREKREADDKAKEERRLAKQAAAEKEEADAAAAATAAAAAAAKAEEAKETKETKEEETKPAEGEGEADEKPNGESTEQKAAPKSREPKEPAKTRAAEAGSWRSASSEQRAPRGPPGPRGGRGGAARGGRNEGRGGPRANGAPAQQASAQGAGDGDAVSVDEDGWTTVPNKKGRQGRP